jgi:hypothetical protein
MVVVRHSLLVRHGISMDIVVSQFEDAKKDMENVEKI